MWITWVVVKTNNTALIKDILGIEAKHNRFFLSRGDSLGAIDPSLKPQYTA